MLTSLIALLGLAALAWGATHYARSRLSRRLENRRELHRRIALTVTGVGGLGLLVPDLIAGLVVTTSDGSALSTVGWVLYRFLALGVIGVAALVMWLVSDPVTSKVRRGRDKVIALAPVGTGKEVRRMRRGLGQFPQEWNALLEHDQALTRRLLRYQRDADAAAAKPVLADLQHPLTQAAVNAMFRCDELRAMAPPERVHDVLATDYGRAVAAFDRALAAAEEYADTYRISKVTPAEHRAVADATRTLSFLQHNATTPQERSEAYSRISEQLTRATRDTAGAQGSQATEPIASSHPWLSVEERARVRDD